MKIMRELMKTTWYLVYFWNMHGFIQWLVVFAVLWFIFG